jgi:hypothetical protein
MGARLRSRVTRGGQVRGARGGWPLRSALLSSCARTRVEAGCVAVGMLAGLLKVVGKLRKRVGGGAAEAKAESERE